MLSVTLPPLSELTRTTKKDDLKDCTYQTIENLNGPQYTLTTPDLYKQASALFGEVYEGTKIIALQWCDIPSDIIQAIVVLIYGFSAIHIIVYKGDSNDVKLPAGLGTNKYKFMLEPKNGKIRNCILAKRHLSLLMLRNKSN